MSDINGERARWAACFKKLSLSDTPGWRLTTSRLQIVVHNQLTKLFLDDVREAVASLRGVNAADICIISEELLKVGSFDSHTAIWYGFSLEKGGCPSVCERRRPNGLQQQTGY